MGHDAVGEPRREAAADTGVVEFVPGRSTLVDVEEDLIDAAQVPGAALEEAEHAGAGPELLAERLAEARGGFEALGTRRGNGSECDARLPRRPG